MKKFLTNCLILFSFAVGVHAMNIDKEIEEISVIENSCQKNTYSDFFERKGNNSENNAEIAKCFVLAFYLVPEKYDLKSLLDYARFDYSDLERLSKDHNFSQGKSKNKEFLIANKDFLIQKIDNLTTQLDKLD